VGAEGGPVATGRPTTDPEPLPKPHCTASSIPRQGASFAFGRQADNLAVLHRKATGVRATPLWPESRERNARSVEESVFLLHFQSDTMQCLGFGALRRGRSPREALRARRRRTVRLAMPDARKATRSHPLCGGLLRGPALLPSRGGP
jgi:hypothetical protein